MYVNNATDEVDSHTLDFSSRISLDILRTRKIHSSVVVSQQRDTPYILSQAKHTHTIERSPQTAKVGTHFEFTFGDPQLFQVDARIEPFETLDGLIGNDELEQIRKRFEIDQTRQTGEEHLEHGDVSIDGTWIALQRLVVDSVRIALSRKISVNRHGRTHAHPSRLRYSLP